jgi:HD domain
VREDVLLKAKKLPPVLQERIEARFDLIRSRIELAWCAAGSGARHTAHAAAQHATELAALERCRQVVRDANEPTVLAAPAAAELLTIAQRTFERPDGSLAPYLMPEELHFLELSKGTLDEHERAEVESHVTKTYRYLSNIPWTDDLPNMVTYAYGHHEALDGSGYPRGLAGEDIPLQTRLITVADMFDALTAADRPYKPAVTAERALEILEREAEAGRLDGELIRVMKESGVHGHVQVTS